MNTAETLRHYFGFDRYRPHQQEIVEAILSGRDVFAALPTGGGKSLCYQLPSLLLPGLTLVVSPLIALMQDQVQGARQNGVPAAYLNSTLDGETARQVYRDIGRGEITLLYASPERLALESFRETLREWNIAFVAVDEAHCISEWGHEFRPDYRSLATLRDAFPGVTIAAFTATATSHVQDDVIRLLRLENPLAIRGNFDRPEIFYRVRRKQQVNDQIRAFIRQHPDQPGIVYRATRKAVEETASHLNGHGISAAGYHAGMSDSARQRNQEQFVRDEVQVVVATIAFGMGIDKSNVRWVVHGDLPRSVEAYYQETGRAGRDGEPSEACLYYGAQDIATVQYHIDRMEVPEEQERARRNLREILRYVDAGVCRRTQLLAHFDQEHGGDCDGCDVCTGAVDTVDQTVAAQKALSAVMRTGERFGAHHIADVVSGTETDRILQFGHHRLPTFGVGTERSRMWWVRLVQDLEAAGLLRRPEGPRSGLAVMPQGKEVLFGRQPFRAVEREDETPRDRYAGSGIAAPASAAKPASAVPMRADQEELFQCLRKLRLRLARERQLPPYVIFSDKSLKAMTRNRPTDMQGLLRIHGVGDKKADQYGLLFLNLIRRFVEGGECPEG